MADEKSRVRWLRWARKNGIKPREEWLAEVRKPGWCSDCKQQLPMEAFSIDNSRPNGISNVCKRCRAVRLKEWRAKLSPEMKEKHRLANNAATIRYRKNPKHQRKVAIHQMVRHAIAAGFIKKGSCEKCGAEKADAHHDDYEKPLEVRWLCRACHSLHHAPDWYQRNHP